MNQNMKHDVLFLILLSITSISIGQTLPKIISETDFSIGKAIKIESTLLDETRELNIYLPINYSANRLKTYPVIYLLDGSKDEDFIHISGIVHFGSFSWINMIPESIVVGIGNVDRIRDFTSPSQNELDQKEYPTSGESDKFIRFLQTELKHFIDSTYRTTDVNTIIGQSLGGLLVTEILIKKPELYDNYIIVSPSLWWNDEKLLTTIPIDYNSNKSIYIAVGKEGEIMERTAKDLYKKLNINKKAKTKLFFDFLETKTHGDALHTAVYNAFELIFKTDKE